MLRDKFQGVFTSAFSSFFDKIIGQTASLKDAFRSLIRDFISQFAKLGQQNFVDQLFSKQGAGGGAPSFLAGLFGASDDRKITTKDFGKRDDKAPPLQQTGGIGGFFSSFFGGGKSDTQKAAPVSEGVPSSFGSIAGASGGVGAEAATALKDVATSSTATSFALKEFADDGVAKATGQLFENVAVSTVESTATQTATGALATLTVAAQAAATALASMAASAAAGKLAGIATSAAGGYTGGHADGGLITGPGTGTSDSVPFMGSNNEFVVRAKPVQEPGALAFLTRFNKIGMAALKIQHLATGGLVRNLSESFFSGSPQMMAVAGGGRINLTQNFTVQPSTPRETQQQFAAAAFQGGARALKRNQ